MPDFFEEFLGMRCEFVDMSEFTRRIEEGIFDPDELEKAKKWIKRNCKEGKDYNPPDIQKSAEKKGRGVGFCCQNGPDRP